MKKGLFGRILGIGLVSLSAVSVTIATLAWFTGPGGQTDKSVDGSLDLRGYFYGSNKGDDSDEPYEIVTSTHFYNLCRLQNIGIFSEVIKFFQIGHNFSELYLYNTDQNQGFLDIDGEDENGNYAPSAGCYVSDVKPDSNPQSLGLACIAKYIDGKPVYTRVLDMRTASESYTILPIGSEGAPFHGHFNGNGVPIKNLKITGYPEDIGVFGYVAYDGVVEGLVCSHLEVDSLGYTSTPPDYSTDLFSRSIDRIFGNQLDPLTSYMNMTFVDNNTLENGEPRRLPLKNPNEQAGVPIRNVNHNSKVAKIVPEQGDPTYSTIYNGYFIPSWPTRAQVGGVPMTFHCKSSSSLLREYKPSDISAGLSVNNADIPTTNSNFGKPFVIDMANLKKQLPTAENSFNDGTEKTVDARLSIVASVEVDGFTFSRVIQSYKFIFSSNRTNYPNGGYSVAIYCDYVNKFGASDKPTEYFHGNNIGFLAGHVDGTFSKCYVYDGTFVLNNGSGCEAIETESQTGLIGEIGTNVINTLDPTYGASELGNTGIMNFTKIYNKIRRDFTVSDFLPSNHADFNDQSKSVFGGRDTGADPDVSYVSYDNIRNLEYNSTTGEWEGDFNLFKDYLRHSALGKYITKIDGNLSYEVGQNILWHAIPRPGSIPSSYNTVDFLWNNVIQDEYDGSGKRIVDRGLGVFKIVTAYNEGAKTGNYENYEHSNMGSSYIINDPTQKTVVYYSTAEYAHKKPTKHVDGSGNTYYTWETDMITNQPAWGTDTGQIDPLRPTTFPSYSDKHSFEYPFSRDYNYCVKLDLTDNMGTNNYMYNTDSDFLTNYFSSILIDQFGFPIEWKDPRFGMMMINSSGESVDYLQSYMPLNKPGSKQDYGSGGPYYPQATIAFEITSEEGANISVVANNADISIYSFDSSTSSGGVTEIYTMRSKNYNTSTANLYDVPTDIDKHRYFEYDGEKEPSTTGDNLNTFLETEVTDDNMLDGKALYAHVFKLKKGEYCIGSSQDTNTNSQANWARLYYLGVQGQTLGEVGYNNHTAVSAEVVNDVDFLLDEPTLADYRNGTLPLAQLSFKSIFNEDFSNKEFNVSTTTAQGNNYIMISFDDPATRPYFVSNLLVVSRNDQDHTFYLSRLIGDDETPTVEAFNRSQFTLPRP